MKNIIVGVDFSNSSYVAMRHAVAIAIKTDADLHLVWIKTPNVSTNAQDFDGGKKFIAHQQEKLTEWAKMCIEESPKTHVNTVILEGKAHIEINTFAKNLPNSIIVLGAHGSSGFEEGYIGNNAFRIINSVDVPVLIMRENIQINRDLHKIFVPIDTSFETLQKMRPSIFLAKAFAAQIYLYGVTYPVNEETRHIINVQLRNAANMCDEANVRYAAESANIRNNNVCSSILEAAKNLDANLITIMREEAETDFSYSRKMREILSTSSMPLFIIPNKNAFSVAK